MRMAVAAEKAREPQCIALCRPTYDDRAAAGDFQQSHAPQDHRAHDPFAEFCFGYQQRSELIRGMTMASTGSRQSASTSDGRSSELEVLRP